MKNKMTRSQLEVENARLRYEIKVLSKNNDIDKIKNYLINNGVAFDLAKILANDIYKMIKGDL